MLTPSRLVLARARRGLTAVDLARKVGLSPSSIRDYESGRRTPDEQTLVALSCGLGFPAEFLSAPEVDELPEAAVAFRAQARLPGRRRAAAIATGQLAVSFNRWLRSTFTLPEPDVPTLEHPDPETAAEMVRARWGLGSAPAPNMVHLLEAHGVRVFSLPVDCADVDAFSFWHAGTPYMLLNPTTSPERGRFDAAHELGHLVLHHTGSSADAEREANVFAGAFLMPRAGILASVARGPVTRQVLEARRNWHVSALALTYRLHDLGLLTDDQYGTMCGELSRRGYRTAEPDGMSRRESSQLLTKVFRVLRESGTTPHQVARELTLDIEELNDLVFGLVLMALPGAAQPAPPARPKLTIVH